MRYIGLRSRVRFRRDLGYVFLDDGERLLFVEEDVFDGAGGENAAALAASHPTIFKWFDLPEKAEKSYNESEI